MSKTPDAALATPDDADRGDRSGESLTRELPRVEAANAAFYDAFRSGDIQEMARLWSKSPHVRCVHPGPELVVGWDDIYQSWLNIFRDLESIDFQLEDVHVEVTGRTAWVNLVAFVDFATSDGEYFQVSVVTTNIFEKVDDQWLMVLHHNSNFVEEDDEEEEDGDEVEEMTLAPGRGWGKPN